MPPVFPFIRRRQCYSQGQENKDVRKSVGSLLMSSMEVSRLEQRAYIKIAVLRDQNARECHAQLLEAVGARALPYRTVARWVAAFESGREATKDKPRTGRPRTVRTDVSRAVIQQCLENDRRWMRDMSQGRAPECASSTIFCRVESGRGRPLTNTPPSWFTPLCPVGAPPTQ
ncbi:hypothetical protein C0J52_08301 [Blattella germanica]|nr:hypothetical protein C0J52_08301 [Blattella germanica]